MYYIGIDGGGAYSRMAAINEEGKVLGKHAGNAADFERFGYDGVKNNMAKLLREFIKMTSTRLSDCKGLCISGTSLNGLKNVGLVEKALRDSDVTCPVRVINDKASLIAAETKGKPGTGLMAGINTMGCAIDSQGGYYQVGDYGHILGDGGSSYAIGLDAVRRALYCADGVIGATSLVDMVKEKFMLEDIREIIPYIDSESLDKSKIAALSLDVKQAAQQGDKAANEIERNAAGALFRTTKVLLERLKLPDAPMPVVLWGDVILTNENIQSIYTQLLHKYFPHAQTMTQRGKPETGAAYLAMLL